MPVYFWFDKKKDSNCHFLSQLRSPGFKLAFLKKRNPLLVAVGSYQRSCYRLLHTNCYSLPFYRSCRKNIDTKSNERLQTKTKNILETLKIVFL